MALKPLPTSRLDLPLSKASNEKIIGPIDPRTHAGRLRYAASGARNDLTSD